MLNFLNQSLQVSLCETCESTVFERERKKEREREKTVAAIGRRILSSWSNIWLVLLHGIHVTCYSLWVGLSHLNFFYSPLPFLAAYHVSWPFSWKVISPFPFCCLAWEKEHRTPPPASVPCTTTLLSIINPDKVTLVDDRTHGGGGGGAFTLKFEPHLWCLSL